VEDIEEEIKVLASFITEVIENFKKEDLVQVK